MKTPSSHLKAVIQALFVTLLWATSWVLIKIGLRDLPALTFAGMRYGLAFLCLLPFALGSARRASIRQLSRQDWKRLILLGVIYYAVTQGAQFVGLAYLPAVTVNLLLNFTSVLVAVLGILILSENPSRQQWLGMGLSLAGILIYFYPVLLPAGQLLGVLVVLAGVVANALSSIFGRRINREARISPLVVTTISMGTGSALLLIGGLTSQPIPQLSNTDWLIIAWLAVVNTAFAFTLWNHTLRTLPAMESSMINSTLLVQIPLLAWLFLGESLTLQELGGMLLVGAGILIVQMGKN